MHRLSFPFAFEGQDAPVPLLMQKGNDHTVFPKMVFQWSGLKRHGDHKIGEREEQSSGETMRHHRSNLNQASVAEILFSTQNLRTRTVEDFIGYKSRSSYSSNSSDSSSSNAF